MKAFLNGPAAGQIDLPRIRQGGFVGGLFAAYLPSPKTAKSVPGSGGLFVPHATPTTENAREVTFSLISTLLRIEAASAGQAKICRSATDIRQCMAQGVLAMVMHIEGAEALDPDLELLDILYAAGLRTLGPLWSRPNIFGQGVPFRFPSSPDTGDITDAPLVASHCNAHALCAQSRNLTDGQPAAIRESRGFVGVNFGTMFLREDGKKDPDATVDEIVRHVDYLLTKLGEEGVGLGSDFDGASVPPDLVDVAGLPVLVNTLAKRGDDRPLLEKICYGNGLRVLERTWGA